MWPVKSSEVAEVYRRERMGTRDDAFGALRDPCSGAPGPAFASTDASQGRKQVKLDFGSHKERFSIIKI